MSFGWHRAEVIGATVSVLMIWVVTGVLVSCTFVTYSGDPKPDPSKTGNIQNPNDLVIQYSYGKKSGFPNVVSPEMDSFKLIH